MELLVVASFWKKRPRQFVIASPREKKYERARCFVPGSFRLFSDAFSYFRLCSAVFGCFRRLSGRNLLSISHRCVICSSGHLSCS